MRLNILTLSTYDMCTTIISNCIQHVHKCHYKTKQCHGPIHQYIINIYLSFFPQSLILFVSPSLPPSLSPPSLSPLSLSPSLPLSLLSPNYLRGGQGLHMTRWMHISRAITVGIILCHIIKTTAV